MTLVPVPVPPSLLKQIFCSIFSPNSLLSLLVPQKGEGGVGSLAGLEPAILDLYSDCVLFFLFLFFIIILHNCKDTQIALI